MRRPIPATPWRRAWPALALLATLPIAARPRSAFGGVSTGALGRDSLHVDSAYAINSCAPTDGPAVTLYLGGVVRGSGINEHVEPPFLQISIWQGWTTLGGQTFTLEHYRGNGYASYCATEHSCERLDAARVSFTEAPPDHLSGTVELTFRGHKIETTFRARHLELRMMCG